MKRSWGIAIIFVLVLGLTLFARQTIDHTLGMVEGALSSAEAQADAGDYPAAKQTVERAMAEYQARQNQLSLFLRAELVNNLAITLAGLPPYANADNESDFLCEIGHARAQAKNLRSPLGRA